MAGNKVTVKYKGSFLDGKVFDQTKEGQPDFVFNVGAKMVIPGWDEGLQLMKEGETCRLLIPWNLGYGEFGSGPIPPFSSLLFDIELVKVEPK
jgi:FKBP-type peptidyl-prolyl cis-trans isomerase